MRLRKYPKEMLIALTVGTTLCNHLNLPFNFVFHVAPSEAHL